MNGRLCYHCHEPVPARETRTISIDGKPEPVCCAGCQAVAQLVLDAGLSDFYRFRSAASARVDQRASQSHWQGFDAPAVLDRYAPTRASGEREVLLQLQDIRCAACSWLIEQTLGDAEGVRELGVNLGSSRARVSFDSEQIGLADILAHLDKLGFRPQPLLPGEQATAAVAERRRYIKRLAVAGLGMMQVMMYAIALYLGGFEPGSAASDSGMDPAIWHFLRAVSLLIATPVVLYAGAPFFRGAWRDLRARRAGMDVPVSLAIGAAYVASVWHTLAGAGEVYFDSVSMFVFFLLIGRFLEFNARHSVAESSQALASSLPATAQRRAANGQIEQIPLADLAAGDTVLIASGEIVPADGELCSQTAQLDEALLSGESRPVTRQCGEAVLAGAINRGAGIDVRIARTGQDTKLSAISRLLDKAQSARPQVARLADAIARRFVAAVLVLAAITALVWWQVDPSRAFEITLAVLVVTCPCALALAVPVALTAATGALARQGTLTVNTDALEQMHRITDVVFDKTGTLTEGRPQIAQTLCRRDLSEQQCLDLAAALEAEANHPLAQAFVQQAESAPSVSEIEQLDGLGMRGHWQGRELRLGQPSFALGQDTAPPADSDGSWIVLADDDGALAWFELRDSLRPEARHTVAALRARGLAVHLLSGDEARPVQDCGKQLGIESLAWRQQPGDKLQGIQTLQQQGRRVLMIGDGLNDAPVLGAADVAIAMSRGASLAQAGADMILTGALTGVDKLFDQAAVTRRIIRQNLTWAASYNLLALPLAATGIIAPWMAAIGMSLSSLLVTLNALRLRQINVSKAGRNDNLVQQRSTLESPAWKSSTY